MMRVIRGPGMSRRLASMGALLVGAMLLGAALPTLANVDSPPTVYHACVTTRTGSIKIVSATAHCGVGQYKISWNHSGPRGVQGPVGPRGPAGPPGKVDGYWSNDFFSEVQLGTNPGVAIVSVEPPAGNYLVTAQVTAEIRGMGATDQVLCYLNVQGVVYNEAYQTLIADPTGLGFATIPVSQVVTITSGATIALWCLDNNGSATGGNADIIAVPLAAVNPASSARARHWHLPRQWGKQPSSSYPPFMSRPRPRAPTSHPR